MASKDIIEIDDNYDVKFKVGLLIIFFSPVLGSWFSYATIALVGYEFANDPMNIIYKCFCIVSILVGGVALFISGLIEKQKTS